MIFDDYVKGNQKIIQMVVDKVPGDPKVDMYYGTLDVATSRFHTILIKVSQDRLLEQEFQAEINDCYKAIQDFYENVQRYRFWPKFFRPLWGIVLHGIGTRRIPKIKKLLNTLSTDLK